MVLGLLRESRKKKYQNNSIDELKNILNDISNQLNEEKYIKKTRRADLEFEYSIIQEIIDEKERRIYNPNKIMNSDLKEAFFGKDYSRLSIPELKKEKDKLNAEKKNLGNNATKKTTSTLNYNLNIIDKILKEKIQRQEEIEEEVRKQLKKEREEKEKFNYRNFGINQRDFVNYLLSIFNKNELENINLEKIKTLNKSTLNKIKTDYENIPILKNIISGVSEEQILNESQIENILKDVYENVVQKIEELEEKKKENILSQELIDGLKKIEIPETKNFEGKFFSNVMGQGQRYLLFKGIENIKTLAQMSKSPTFENLNLKGYQRKEEVERIKELKNYYERKGGLYLPEIILGVHINDISQIKIIQTKKDIREGKYKNLEILKNSKIKFREKGVDILQIINKTKNIQNLNSQNPFYFTRIDGNHRLEAALKTQDKDFLEYYGNVQFSVIIFLEEKEQIETSEANIFYYLNDKQKKISIENALNCLIHKEVGDLEGDKKLKLIKFVYDNIKNKQEFIEELNEENQLTKINEVVENIIDKKIEDIENFTYKLFELILEIPLTQEIKKIKNRNDYFLICCEIYFDLIYNKNYKKNEKKAIFYENLKSYANWFSELNINEEVNNLIIWKIFKKYQNIDNKTIKETQKEFDNKDKEIIDKYLKEDENNNLEFKSSLEWCTKQGCHNKDLQLSCLKTINAFLNTDGGTLLIGIAEDESKKPFVIGLNNSDYKKHKNKDNYELHLRQLLNKIFSLKINKEKIEIKFFNYDDKDICLINVRKNNKFNSFEYKENGKSKKEYCFIRDGNRTIEPTKQEIIDLIQK